MFERALLRRDRAREPLLAAGLAGGLFLATRLLPASSVGGGLGTPLGVILMGAVSGALSALTATGIVLIYRTSRIINFAQAALGAVGAVFTYNFVIALGWPYLIALVLGIGVSAGLGVAVELMLRRFFDAPRLVRTIATIGAMGMLGGAVHVVNGLALWGDQRTALEGSLSTPIRPFSGCCFRVAPYRFEFGHLLAIILVPAALVTVGLFLRRTRLGAAVRATGENVERAEMLGINVRRVSTAVWAIAGTLAGIGVIVNATATSFGVTGQANVAILLPSLAAAVLARMRSLPMAAGSAVGISILQESIGWAYPETATTIMSVVLLVIVVVGPLLMRKTLVRDREVSSWAATEDLREVPAQLAATPEVRSWRSVGRVVLVLALLVFPWAFGTAASNIASTAAIEGMVILSLIVLTGWTGQISLGQWGFVAIGALLGGALMEKAHIPFWLVVPIGGAVTSAFAFVIGIPALRIRGLMLAVSSFAFAFVVQLCLFNARWFGWLRPDRVERPTLLMLNFEDARSMYYLAVLFLGLSYLLVRVLRRGRPGRVLIALRENEDDLAAMGSDPVLTRLSGFALAGFIAGVAGVIFAVQQRSVAGNAFGPEESLTLFLYAVIGGLGSPSGAVAATIVVFLQQYSPSDPLLSFFLNPSFGVLVMLYLAPRGLVGLAVAVRDSMLRIVSQRRGIPAPSLFADMDEDVIARRLVLLAGPIEGRGLAAAGGRRYRLRSEIHGVARASAGRAPDEAAALASAVEAFEERQSADRPAPAGEG